MRFSLVCTVLLAVACFACGSKKISNFDGGEEQDGGIVDEDSGIITEQEAGDDAGCVTCSPDLKTIVTCGTMMPVGQCSGPDGCAGGTCIPACDAASKAKSTVGCDYYMLPPDAWTIGSCFAAFVTNTWSVPMKVTLTWKGQNIDGTKYAYVPKGMGASITYQLVPSSGIPANTMAIVFINDSKMNTSYYVGCPNGVTAAISGQQIITPGTRIADTIGLQTSVPAVVYDIYPYGGMTSYMPSATLLIPSTAWDTNYVTATMSEDLSGQRGGFNVMASVNGTKVTVLPKSDIMAGTGVNAAMKNQQAVYTLNKGQTLHVSQNSDIMTTLSGSIIQSTQPVGVTGEHYCMVHQQQNPRWRMVGAVDGTILKYDPAVGGAPTALKRGDMIEFDGPEAFHVTSQDDKHPFYLAAYRPGSDCDAAHQQIPSVQQLGYEYAAISNETMGFSMGGPETVNVIPPAQFLNEYAFFTDPTFSWTDLTIVRTKVNGQFKDVTLDCLGKVTGWKPLGTKPYEYAHASLQQNHQPVGKCDNGLHNIKSDAPFGITVWGYDSASSYAYPAGASVKPINTVIVPPTPN